jgi:hypothetical protein
MSKVLEEKVEQDKFIWKPNAVEKVVDESRFHEVSKLWEFIWSAVKCFASVHKDLSLHIKSL